jgi:hypothetical protein
MDDRSLHALKASALGASSFRDLGLTTESPWLAPILAEFMAELGHVGIRYVRPRIYLSTEWGVPEGTVAIAIPFYLARPDLTALHSERVGHVEGVGRVEILRYLRHEMGHVLNYAYKLFETPEWVDTFGETDRPYLEEYRLEPFSRRFVRLLPGWYPQIHPDEDWAETFAVWLTPGLDWRSEYNDWPEALAKLQYCDRTVPALANLRPLVTADDPDEDVNDLSLSLDAHCEDLARNDSASFPAGIDAAIRSVFDHPDGPDATPASGLILSLERELTASVYHWTGHFPERTRSLVRHLAVRADDLGLTYSRSNEAGKTVGLTTLVTALAMNHVERGAYLV